jgi:antitoxin component of RelBE/YafQ-DinJ toxin-antitoxin module
MKLATEKRKISAYLEGDIKDSAEKLAKSRGMSLSTLVAFLLTQEIRKARLDGEIVPPESIAESIAPSEPG